jgi:hypothetical protein
MRLIFVYIDACGTRRVQRQLKEEDVELESERDIPYTTLVLIVKSRCALVVASRSRSGSGSVYLGK